MEHGFVKHLYKRCRVNSKRLDECTQITTKQNAGGKVTAEQLAKLSKHDDYQSELNNDLATLELFLQHTLVNTATKVEETPVAQPEEKV
jgi:hypothetical protein